MSAPCKELVTLLSEYAMVCRGCLAASGEMKNMFEWGLHKEFAKYTDVQIRRADGISELICSACEESLVICKNFRSQCQQSDLLLRKSLMQSQTQNFDYKYALEEVHLLECKQFEMVSVEEIKKEHEEETEEDNVEANNINIKEEEEDWADTYQEVSLNTADVKSETPSDDDTPLKQLLEGASPRKRTLNVVHQRDTKRAKLDETAKDRNPLTNTVLKIFPTKNRKTLYKSFSKKSSVDSNVKSSKNKLNIKSVANRHQGSRISPKVNTVPTHKIRVKNLVAQNSETSASNVVCDNAENETFKPCLPKSVDAVASNSRLHKDTVEKPYKCDLCDYRCPRRGNLETHIKYKHTKEKNFSCHMCQYKCVTKSRLSIHLRKHTGEKPYKCDICDYRCSHRGNLEAHIKYKHTKEKSFSCHVCQHKCVTKSDLSKHLRQHTGEKPYKCDICDYRCSHGGYLETHIKHKHTKEKNFSCHVCQYKCVTKSELSKHFRQHTGEKPYECDFCDYRCLRRDVLENHIKYKHTKEKNFSCHMCHYKCVRKDQLNLHLRKHTGEKPYQCDLCDYRCSFKCNLNNHTLSKHTE